MTSFGDTSNALAYYIGSLRLNDVVLGVQRSSLDSHSAAISEIQPIAATTFEAILIAPRLKHQFFLSYPHCAMSKTIV